MAYAAVMSDSRLEDFIAAHRRLFVLTGAGCSTGSGIPDYRGPGSVGRVRRPIQYREFIASPAVRVRYWSRSMVGWPRIRAARPNAAVTVTIVPAL